MTETKVKGKGLAIAGLVVGIVAIILSIFSIGVTLGAIGLILAGIGFVQLNKTNGPKGIAITGIILSVLAIAISFYMASKLTALGSDLLNQMEENIENIDEHKSLEQLEQEFNDALNDAGEE
jgi:Na+/melibiose symporter-like transporter